MSPPCQAVAIANFRCPSTPVPVRNRRPQLQHVVHHGAAWLEVAGQRKKVGPDAEDKPFPFIRLDDVDNRAVSVVVKDVTTDTRSEGEVRRAGARCQSRRSVPTVGPVIAAPHTHGTKDSRAVVVTYRWRAQKARPGPRPEAMDAAQRETAATAALAAIMVRARPPREGAETHLSKTAPGKDERLAA